jgi:hypothetical protein
MSTLLLKVNQLINSVEREYRTPLTTALRLSNGDCEMFAQELDSLSWDYPDLDFGRILDRLNS